MSPDSRLPLYALGAIVALIVLIARFKVHPFIALIVASLAMGTAAGMPLAAVVTGAGSLVVSHVNDSGFWLIKEFFDMTVVQTLQTWTVAETIIGVAGLGFTLLLNLVV
jgi:GntP family gluconate:H+ symporter